MPTRDCLIHAITLARQAVAQLEGKYLSVQVGGGQHERREALVQLHKARLYCDDLQIVLDTYDAQQDLARQQGVPVTNIMDAANIMDEAAGNGLPNPVLLAFDVLTT